MGGRWWKASEPPWPRGSARTVLLLPCGFTSWSAHWSKAVAGELAQEQSEQIDDHVGIWGGMLCQWAREIGAEPRFLSLALAQAFLQTEQPTLTPDLPRDISCFRLLLPKGTLFSEEGPEIRSVVVAEAYRTDFGQEPPLRQQFVDGAPRQVKSHRRSWLIDTIKRFRAQLAGG